MQTAVIAGVVAALVPAVALAQTKVELGDGVSVVFPEAPAKIHATPEPPSGPPANADTKFVQAVRSIDTWMLRMGGATFRATAMTPRETLGAARANCSGPPLPVPPGAISPCDSAARDLASPPEDRRVMNGVLFVSRSVQVNGHIYGVSFIRGSEAQLAKIDPTHQTPPDAAGEAFLNSFKVAPSRAK